MLLIVGGYALLLLLQRQPVGPGEPVELTAMPNLPEPVRLPRHRSWVPASLETADAFPPQLRELAVVVRDLPAPWRRAAGVGVFDDLGMRWDWAPLSGTGEPNAPLRAAVRAPAGTAVWLAVAGSEEIARRGYWTRCPVPADADASAPIELHAPVQQVRVHTGALDRQLTAALRLRRVGDADWAPVAAADGPLGVDRRGDLVLELGPGTYELLPWADGAFRPVRIGVPGPGEVTATFGP